MDEALEHFAGREAYMLRALVEKYCGGEGAAASAKAEANAATARKDAEDARRELAEDIHPQLLDARAKYTDWVEPVAEEVVATGDDGWD